MIGDSFTVNSKKYTVKTGFTVGDKRKMNVIQGKFNDLVDSKLSPKEMMDEQDRIVNEQDNLMCELLVKILELTDDELNSLEYPKEVTQVFHKMLQVTTEPEKKKSKPLDSSISQETQAYLKH